MTDNMNGNYFTLRKNNKSTIILDLRAILLPTKKYGNQTCSILTRGKSYLAKAVSNAPQTLLVQDSLAVLIYVGDHRSQK